jgi:hypothetical protein
VASPSRLAQLLDQRPFEEHDRGNLLELASLDETKRLPATSDLFGEREVARRIPTSGFSGHEREHAESSATCEERHGHPRDAMFAQ